MIQGHGSDKHRYRREIVADFSSNVWFRGYPKELPDVLYAEMKELVHYPEPEAETLRSKLAKLHSLKDEQVIVGNGSVELFYLLAQAYRGVRSGVVIPAFAEYEDACQIHDHQLSFFRQAEIQRKLDVDLLWIGNPNNPDGQILTPETVLELCAANPQVLFVVDEAYAELSYDFRSVIPHLDQTENLIVMHSLTKTFCMPGIRLGYAVASEAVIAKMNAIRIPWSVNSLAIAAGCYIVDRYTELIPDVNELKAMSEAFANKLRQLDGVKLLPTSCNYFLLELDFGTAAALKHFLVEKHGILIRDASNFRGLSNRHFRVALQTPEKNEMLIAALKEFIQQTEKTVVEKC